MSNNLILCGLPGVGKSVVSQALSSQLGWQIIDTDKLVEAIYLKQYSQSLSCREIYKKLGEEAFRNLEHLVLTSLLGNREKVIAIGGGTLNAPQNRSCLKQLGLIVYLKNEHEVIYHRLMGKGMPAYLDAKNPRQSFEQIAQQREPIYESVADVTIHTQAFSPAEIASKIIEKRN